MHRFTIRVRYCDTDQMGFAHHGNHLSWFEIGRTEMMRSLGRSYREIEARGIWLPVLEARCRYVRPARYDDDLVIETGVLELERASVRFGYRVRRVGTDELVAYGETEHCYMSPAQRPVRPPQELLDLLKRAPAATLPEVDRARDVG